MKTHNATNNRSPSAVSPPVIWTKGKVNLPIPRSPAKPQITLLHLGLCPIGKGALVVTGKPMGTGADGRFRRLEVGLCIMWPGIAVTVSLLSLPQRRSDPHSSSYLRVRVLFFPPFPSRNFPKLVNCCAGNMKGDSLTFFFFHVNQLESSCKERLGAGVVSS